MVSFSFFTMRILTLTLGFVFFLTPIAHADHPVSTTVMQENQRKLEQARTHHETLSGVNFLEDLLHGVAFSYPNNWNVADFDAQKRASSYIARFFYKDLIELNLSRLGLTRPELFAIEHYLFTPKL